MAQVQAAVLLAARDTSVLIVTFSEGHCVKVENISVPVFHTANESTKVICHYHKSSTMGEGKHDAPVF